MPEIEIRNCKKDDEQGILDVCYRTGFMGEDLTGTDRFNDILLFGLIFCLYYPRYEAEHCFVAVDKDIDKIAGYVIGTDNTKKQKLASIFRIGWKVVLRTLFYSSFKYNESFKSVIHFLKSASVHEKLPQNFNSEYPSHLHINILPEYQHMGLGSALIDTFEKHMHSLNAPGIHLVTTNKNLKAIPFYLKKGYRIIAEHNGSIWPGIKSCCSLTFGKKL